MKALRELRRFILIKSAEGQQGEVRSFVIENVDRLAKEFLVSAHTIMVAVETVQDDVQLAERLLETIHHAEEKLRTLRKVQRSGSAKESGKLLGQAAEWRGERAYLDMPSIFASVLTRRQDLLVFEAEDFSVAVYMGPLLDLAKIARARLDLTGYVDREGLHLVWRTGRLNLLPRKEDQKAERVVVALARRSAVAAA
jgi:hypothetical protein